MYLRDTTLGGVGWVLWEGFFGDVIGMIARVGNCFGIRWGTRRN